MAKEIQKKAKLQFMAGQAKPGPALAGVGINMPEFTKAFNDQTRERGAEPVPVLITVYKDKSFDFKLFTSPTSFKLVQASKVKKGSGVPNKEKVGSISLEQLKEIAEYKMPDMNANTVEAAMRQVAGTAKNMGITIDGYEEWIKGSAN
ncbi:50S ribosomal protein L11 [Mycoplasmopsis arginini]|uniref:Large ribosomal subunit protein uL11 n=1 Tax=Mycoplasmopsis arginini TaxID=2094 RepID=A0AA43QXN0_MYCAR|nr:50S ribosomal protein L11 [Mycoplasmopsis arginini]ENY69906.1 50S ribosomal protein L11 [Mycoplasmopsis arginini 7264]MCY2902997.1 50S ribosomal protein L11 [Mycoplasmopsis arginini QMP CG1-2758]MDI3348177.1 50S ribosomal protein L11 [Mycoplasmopsis arginini]MDI3349136.1 50S ribosomal protein L11 [Mycoplasmopsis arginini]MDI3349844.1 50S ribosomal protein L11 [Mycoplasmopsis arginini]